jgi:ABC-type multidrug transport system ATPase subunit
MLEFKSVRDHKGFELVGGVDVKQGLIVLTGKNGSGKTRFLESIANGAIVVKKDDESLDLTSIRIIEHKALIPQIHAGYDEAARKEKVRSLKQVLLDHRDKLDGPLDMGVIQQHLMIGRAYRNNNFNLSDAHKIIGAIAKRRGKKPSEISSGEIECYYNQYEGLTFGAYDISGIFNDYMKRREDNLFFRWLKEERGRDEVYYVPEESFESELGGPPWLALNLILKDIFKNKFKFSEPGKEYDPAFRTELCLSEGGAPIESKDLSSGEQTLLWLVLTVFNTGFSKMGNTELPKLLLIDEPDAFLHPSMVLRMINCFELFCETFKADVVITTHSPTTVALASSEAIYVADNNKIYSVDQDEAITELLDGITKISINPNNRRQVYVESSNDVDIFEMLYGAVVRKSGLIEKKISLSFVSAGVKFPKNLVSEKLKEHFGELDQRLIEQYTISINGVGGCKRVLGAVEHLCEAGAINVRGLIDRDLDNKPEGHVHVLGGGVCYAIENLVFDPICTMLQAHILDDKRFSMLEVCGADVAFDQWLKDDDLLQVSADRYIESIMQRPNLKDICFEYVGGKRIWSDSDYLNHQGHSLWQDKVQKKYDLLKRLGKTEDGVKKEIVRLSMLLHTKGEFIPLLFVESFSSLQK